MLRKLLSVVLSGTMLLTAIASGQSDVRTKAGALPPGTRLEVELSNGEKLRGRLGSVSPADLELRSPGKGGETVRKVAFADVQSLKVKKGLSTKAKVGIGLGIFGVMAALVAGLVLGAIARNG